MQITISVKPLAMKIKSESGLMIQLPELISLLSALSCIAMAAEFNSGPMMMCNAKEDSISESIPNGVCAPSLEIHMPSSMVLPLTKPSLLSLASSSETVRQAQDFIN